MVSEFSANETSR
jgi:hypothetical protein